MSALTAPPRRIQRRRTKGWRLPPNTVCVDRTTRWGNPFVVGKDGTREECVAMYRERIRGGSLNLKSDHSIVAQGKLRDHVWANWRSLVGKNLACFCELDEACHADPLLELVADLASMYPDPVSKQEPLSEPIRTSFCKLDQPCHADVLLEIANAPA